MSEIPIRINIDKKDRDLFNELDREDMLKYKGGKRTRKEQFFFALACGFKNDVSQTLDAKEGWFNTRDLQPKDEALLNAIAMHKTKSVDIVSDKAAVFRIAEEYAHAGIKIVCGKINSTQYGSFDKLLEKDLYGILEKMKV